MSSFAVEHLAYLGGWGSIGGVEVMGWSSGGGFFK
jgi:hypothetical protein